MAQKNQSKLRGAIVILAAVLVVAGLYTARIVFGGNIYSNSGQEKIRFAVETGSTVDNIIDYLEKDLNVKHPKGLKIAAKVLDLEHHIYPGLYELQNGMSAFEAVRLFRSGKRATVRLSITNARHYEEVLELVSEKLEAKYEDLIFLTNNRQFMDSLGFNKANTICLFLPDTYEFYWNTSARQFLERMAKEYSQFWTEKRRKKASNIGLTPQQVMTLASIVDQETRHNDEKPRIAGVYMNRLHGTATAGKLQADPTIKFALNDFEIKRVRKGHIERAKTSPYSTYEHKGLPPGPICLPSKAGIDAVLNYEHHGFYFFCAQPNYSGYSNFSTTFEQHRNYATAYQKWLNQEGF
ncbi:MAG: endolytic transglycosylase MltG [Bacteroidales bacterium]|nr:endolytic transglycosylase MltG [Bacteroidales bacterium]